MAIIDSYSENNYTSDGGLATEQSRGQTFTGNGATLGSCKFYMYKYNLPTGNLNATIYAHTGTWGYDGIPTGQPLAISDTILAQNLPVAIQLVRFTFSGSNRITLQDGVHYCLAVEYTNGGENTGSPQVGVDFSESSTHGGNYIFSVDLVSWHSMNNYDSIFYVYDTNEVIIASHLLGLTGVGR